MHNRYELLLNEDHEYKQVIVFMDELPLNRQIRVKRVADGFTLQELAEKLGMGVSTLSEIENDKRRIPFKHRGKLEDYLYREFYFDKEFVGPIDQ
jgi:transcriptional regulator with XRE-family HTH domain